MSASKIVGVGPYTQLRCAICGNRFRATGMFQVENEIAISHLCVFDFAKLQKMGILRENLSAKKDPNAPAAVEVMATKRVVEI